MTARPAAPVPPPARIERGSKSATHDPRGPTYCERHRHECEVRHVAAMDAERRAAHFALCEKKRGADATGKLRADVIALLNGRVQRRAAAASTVAAQDALPLS